MHTEMRRSVRTWRKMIGATRVHNGDGACSVTGFEIHRRSGIGQVGDYEVSFLYLGENPSVDVVVVFNTVDPYGYPASSSEQRQKELFVPLIGVGLFKGHGHKTAKRRTVITCHCPVTIVSCCSVVRLRRNLFRVATAGGILDTISSVVR